MKANIGSIDRILRLVIGAALLAWVLFFGGPVWAWVGIVAIGTAVINFCPLYSILGVNTCKTK
ncbi:MAG: DUF2892 domain-containing protein [Methylophilaceae bacterium]